MPKFRKKPVIVEAIQFIYENFNDLEVLLASNPYTEIPQVIPWNEFRGEDLWNKELTIVTLEGNMIASYGDWIIKGVKGELYPCKPDIFERTYEPVYE